MNAIRISSTDMTWDGAVETALVLKRITGKTYQVSRRRRKPSKRARWHIYTPGQIQDMR